MGRRNKQLLASWTLHRGWPDSWGCPLACKTPEPSQQGATELEGGLAMRRWAV